MEDLFATGRFPQALSRFLDLPPDPPPPPRTRLLAATAAARTGAYSTARRLAAEALAAFDQAGSEAGRIQALNLLGGIAFETGRLEEAESLYRDVAARAESLRDRPVAARARTNLASLAHLRGEAGRAADGYLDALEAYQSLNDARGRAQVHHNLGLVFRELGRREEAAHHVAEALRLAHRSGDRPLVALALMGRAELALAERDGDAAHRDAYAGRAIARDGRDRFGVAEGRRVMALVALHRGQAGRARRLAARARGEALALEAGLLAAECGVVEALALLRLGEATGAESLAREAAEAFRCRGALGPLQRLEHAWGGAPA